MIHTRYLHRHEEVGENEEGGMARQEGWRGSWAAPEAEPLLLQSASAHEGPKQRGGLMLLLPRPHLTGQGGRGWARIGELPLTRYHGSSQ